MSERAIGGQGDDNIKCHPFFEVYSSRKSSTVETKSFFFRLGKLKLCTAPNRRVGGSGNVGKASAGPESTSYSCQATTTTPLLFSLLFPSPELYCNRALAKRRRRRAWNSLERRRKKREKTQFPPPYVCICGGRGCEKEVCVLPFFKKKGSERVGKTKYVT